jgi:hypothetical protein
MNKGNFHHQMEHTTNTRVHTTPKRILHHDDPILDDKTKCAVVDYFAFLDWINAFESLSLVENSITEGKWKLLFAIVRGFADSSGVNYCIYENCNGLLFDVTTHSIEYNESQMANITVVTSESLPNKLQRLVLERSQIDLKIKSLQDKRIGVNDRIRELVNSLVGDEITAVGA